MRRLPFRPAASTPHRNRSRFCSPNASPNTPPPCSCAGLSVFKPFRLLLRLATAALLALLLVRNGVSRRTLGTVVCSVLLTYSEDAIALLNRHGSVRQLLRRAGLLRGDGSSSGGDPANKRAPSVVRWELDVKGMRCQACAARIRAGIAALPGVHNATVELTAGSVEVWAESDGSVTGDKLAALVLGIDESYTVAVTARDCFTADDKPAACGGALGGSSSGGSSGGSGGALREVQMAELDATAAQQQEVEQQHHEESEGRPSQQQLQRRRPGAASSSEVDACEL